MGAADVDNGNTANTDNAKDNIDNTNCISCTVITQLPFSQLPSIVLLYLQN